MLASDSKSNKVIVMSEILDEARIGWGEPLQLTGDEADDLRRVLVGCSIYISDSESAERLRRIAIPPVVECESMRSKIEGVARFIANLESSPHPEDSDYDTYYDALSDTHAEVGRAYENRILGCEMTFDDVEDLYECRRCDFEQRTWS